MARRTSQSDGDTGGKPSAWSAVLATALHMPGARVDRDALLRSKLGACLSADDVERAVGSRAAWSDFERPALRRAADSVIQWHRVGVTATSVAIGVPGGAIAVGAMPADVAQYFFHAIVLLQELAYLYGWPCLFPSDGEIDDDTRRVFTLFIGVMWEADGAEKAVEILWASIGTESANRVPRSALTNVELAKTAEAIAKWMAIKLAKKRVTELLTRAVPLVGGAVGGGMTWVSFGKSAQRLRDHLEDISLARPGA